MVFEWRRETKTVFSDDQAQQHSGEVVESICPLLERY